MNKTTPHLPKGYSIVVHPQTKLKFVLTPKRQLVPRQGDAPVVTDQDLINDFWPFYERTVLKVPYTLTAKGYVRA